MHTFTHMHMHMHAHTHTHHTHTHMHEHTHTHTHTHNQIQNTYILCSKINGHFDVFSLYSMVDYSVVITRVIKVYVCVCFVCA